MTIENNIIYFLKQFIIGDLLSYLEAGKENLNLIASKVTYKKRKKTKRHVKCTQHIYQGSFIRGRGHAS